MSMNQSVYKLNLIWNEKRFVESKSARLAARRSIFRAATVLLNSSARDLELQNEDIRHEINRCYSDLRKYDDKLHTLDNMTQLATQSLEIYFQKRMENIRSFVSEQCRIISDGIQEEADHWKEIHAMLQQKLVVPGDLRSYGGGNGLPRGVKQSPNISQIVEENEENDVSTLLQSRTLTPLITQTLKKARLLASKLSQDTSLMVPKELNISTTVQAEEEEEIAEPLPVTSINHVTLGDVSAIEQETEPEHRIEQADLSMSLLPFMPTMDPPVDEEDGSHQSQQQQNKSIASTISDKTFVKTSLKGFSSDEDETDDDEDDDETIVEDSLVGDAQENARPLLLTADRSIRRPTTISVRGQTPSSEKKIKRENVTFREPLVTEATSPRKTVLLNTNTFDATISNSIRPTIVENDEPTPSSTTVFAEPDPPKAPSAPTPVVDEASATKQRATRRTTIRLLRESQQSNLPSQPPAEIPIKTRYATRYSTRLAAAVVHEEKTVRRQTTRLTSE